MRRRRTSIGARGDTTRHRKTTVPPLLAPTYSCAPQYAGNIRILREELIHVQQGREGSINSVSVVEAEIQARELMIQFRDRWGITDSDVQEMMREIEQMRQTGRY